MAADRVVAPGGEGTEWAAFRPLARAVTSPLPLAASAAVAVAALTGPIGADFRWAGALGRVVLDRLAVPDGVPFATAGSSGWPNVTVLAQIVTAGAMDALGDRGLFLLQVAAVAVAFAALARAMRRSGAKDTGGAVALLLVVAGGFGTIAVARLQLFSLALFGVLLAILHDRPARRRLWWLPALFALWANLHGGVLVGLGVAALYLAAEELRVRPRHALGIFAASVAAVLLATPALFRTPEYFLGVMRSEAAVHGEGLWAPLSTAPLDVVLVVAAVLLAAAAWRGRPRAWEVLAVLALAALTVHTARSGIWLVMALSVPAARGIGLRLRLRPGAGAIVAGVLVAAVVYGLVRGPLPFGAGGGAVPVALAAAGGGPILAQDVFAEQVVAAGGTIVLGNPLDAFSLEDQRLYLDWTSGRPGGDPLLRRAHVALVRVDSGAAARLVATGRFRELRRFGGLAVYVDATAGRGS